MIFRKSYNYSSRQVRKIHMLFAIIKTALSVLYDGVAVVIEITLQNSSV